MEILGGNLLIAVARVLDIVLDIYFWVIIVASLITWVNPDPYNPIVRFLQRVTDPVLQPVRRLIGARLGPFDFSPLVVLLAILFIQKFIVASLFEIGFKINQGGR